MNNREAINILKRQADGYYPETTEALNVAIKALEHEPCEDAISRQAVKELFKKKCVGECECCSNYNDADECGLLDELPPVEPKREHGEWKRRLTDNGFNADWHCGKCGWKSALEPCGYNFCPNCGADMRGKKE